MTDPQQDDRRRPVEDWSVVRVACRHGRWLAVAMIVTVAGCAAGTWWQAQRALAGNQLSRCYCFLWPIYGCYVIYVWLRLRREAASLTGPGTRAVAQADSESDEEELARYNRYLASKRADAQRRAR